MCKLALGVLLTVLTFDVGLVLTSPASRTTTDPKPVARQSTPPVLSTTVAEEVADQSNSKGPQLGDTGPDVVVIDELADHYGPVVFDHFLHVGMCEFGGRCDNCHHNAETDREVAACKTCHPADAAETEIEQPGLKGAYHRQCLSCHREWSHENACGFCHEEAARGVDMTKFAKARHAFSSSAHLRVQATFFYDTTKPGTPVVTFHHQDHTELFGLSCIDCHDGASCSECHGPTPDTPKANHEALCLKCHGDQSCTFCHDIAPRGRFEHTRSTGWNLGIQHSDLACTKCHGQTKTFKEPISDACKACHRGGPSRSFDHAITGVPMFGSHAYFQCTQCHHSTSGDQPGTCEQCHTDRSYPDSVPGLPSVSSRLIGLWISADGEIKLREVPTEGDQ